MPYTNILTIINAQMRHIWENEDELKDCFDKILAFHLILQQKPGDKLWLDAIKKLEHTMYCCKIDLEESYQLYYESLQKTLGEEKIPNVKGASASTPPVKEDAHIKASVNFNFIKRIPIPHFWPREITWKLFLDDDEYQTIYSQLLYDYTRIKKYLNAFKKEEAVISNGEPGYMRGMQKAFAFIEHTLTTVLSPEYIITLHDIAMEECSKEPGLRTKRCDFGIIYSTATLEGIKELLNYSELVSIYIMPSNEQLKNTTNLHDVFNKIQKAEIYLKVYAEIIDPQVLMSKMQKFIADYNANIKNAKNSKDKILVIVQLARALEIMHPFLDGNARTFGFLLTNKLLMENGLGPALMNPNKVEGHSCREFATLIENGIESAKQERERYLATANQATQNTFKQLSLMMTHTTTETHASPASASATNANKRQRISDTGEYKKQQASRTGQLFARTIAGAKAKQTDHAITASLTPTSNKLHKTS